MNLAGIVGGLGPESTLQYYRLIVDGYRARAGDDSFAPFIINNVNMRVVMNALKSGSHRELEDYLANEATRLARAGADFATIAACTPHVVFPALRARSPIPLMSIVEVTRDAALRAGMRRPGLFGSRYTMEGRFFPEVFKPAGVDLVSPNPDEIAFIHEKYISELVDGNFLPATRDALVAIAQRMIRDDEIDGLILGGTELPLLIVPGTEVGVPLLDTTRIHVEAILDAMLEPAR